jgi:hypothetical protein
VAGKVGSSVFVVLVMTGFEWQMNGGACCGVFGLFVGSLCPCINAVCLLSWNVKLYCCLCFLVWHACYRT